MAKMIDVFATLYYGGYDMFVGGNYLAHLGSRLSRTSTDDQHKKELLSFLNQFKSKAFSATSDVSGVSDVIKKEKGLVEYFCQLVNQTGSSDQLLKDFNLDLRTELSEDGAQPLKSKDLCTSWVGTNVIPKQDIIKNIIFKYCIELSYNHGKYTNYDISTTGLVQKPIRMAASDQQQRLGPTTESDFSKIFKTIVSIAVDLDKKSHGELINSDFSNFEKVKKHLLINGASISVDVNTPFKLVETLFNTDPSSITLTFAIPKAAHEVLIGSSIIGRVPYAVATDTLSHDNINTLKSFIGPYRKIGYINVSLEGFNYQCDSSLGDLLGKINESPLDESLKLRRLQSGKPITFDDLHKWLECLPKEHFKLNAANKLQDLAALKLLAKPLSQPLTADTKDALIDEVNTYLANEQKIRVSEKYMDLLRHLQGVVHKEFIDQATVLLTKLKDSGVVVADADIALDGQTKQAIIESINDYLPEGYKVTNDDSPYAAVLAELHGVVQRVGQVYARFLQLTGKDSSALIASIQSEDQPVVNELRSFLIDGDEFEFGYNELLNPFQNLDQLLRAFEDKFYTQILKLGIITECAVFSDSIYDDFEVKIRELMPQIIANYNEFKALLGGEFDFFDTFAGSEPIPAYACLIDLAKQISNGLYSDGQAEAESKKDILKAIVDDASKLKNYSERVFDCYKKKLTALANNKDLELSFETISNYDQLQSGLLNGIQNISSSLGLSIGSVDGIFVSPEASTWSPTASPTAKTTGHKKNMSGRKPFNDLYNAFKNLELSLGSASVHYSRSNDTGFQPQAISGDNPMATRRPNPIELWQGHVAKFKEDI